ITVDKNAAYPVAIDELREDQTLKAETELRQSKYLNNIVEQDYRNIKRIVKPMMGFKSFNSARRTLIRIEVRNFMRVQRYMTEVVSLSERRERFTERVSELQAIFQAA
nr:DDE-type integrase/transposase/recombinase [Phormidium tenue FACHB-886]